MESKQPFNRGSDRARPRMDMRDAQRLLDAAPPHAIEAEMSLLGSILIDPKVVGDVVQFPTPDAQGQFAGAVRDLRQDQRGEAVLFDFNHPLAGQPVTFEVHVIGIL